MIRLLVVDDNEIIRFGLHALFDVEPDIAVIGMAANGRVAVSMAIADPPDVILMDLSMPVLDGVAATREIVSAAPSVQVLVLTASSKASALRDALDAGACGYMLKDTPPGKLVDAVRAAARGETFLAPAIRTVLSAQA